MSSILDYAKAYASIIKTMSMSDVFDIIRAYGDSVKFEMDNLPDEGDGVLTKTIYMDRLNKCLKCPIKNGNTCDPTKQRKHVDTGQTINGCGCNLVVKQKQPNYECPAGEWKKVTQ
jgi:hypothetical protein